MSHIQLAKTISVSGNYDVIVGGGGPAGVIAAIAAARNGAKTLLIERYGFLGGAPTNASVTPISEFNKKGRRIINGIPWELIERLHALGGAETDWPIGNVPFDMELYKLVAQRMVRESGAELLLHTEIIGVQMDGSKVTHLLVHNKTGIHAFEGKFFIDATGDADIALEAGIPMQPAAPGSSQPATLCFRLAGVETNKVAGLCAKEENTKYANAQFRQILESLPEDIPPFGGPWFSYSMREGIVNVNITRRVVDISDARQMSDAECTLREDAFLFADLIRRFMPGFENSYLLFTGVQAGYRETRRILGAHTLTGEEFVSGVVFEDTIAKGAHPVDIHRAGCSRQDVQFLTQAGSIPYRSLYNPEFRNLLVAGRTLSADDIASASVRVQAPCMAMGQAAGTSAALCCRDGCDVTTIPVGLLRDTLREQGAVVD